MNKKLSRRDFIKLAGMMSLGAVIPPSVQNLKSGMLQANKQNVLIVLFDALSAEHISLYGYERSTTPNLARLSNRAVVFHNHFASGNYTTPATASLLTGTIPWTHRAIRFRNTVKRELSDKSIFHAFNDYHRLGFSHNTLADTLLEQFSNAIEDYIPQEKYFLFDDGPIREVFENDEDIATVGWARSIKKTDGLSYSLFLNRLYEKYRDNKIKEVLKSYPYGLPNINVDNYYVFEDGIRSLGNQVVNLPQPFLGYIHLFPPHAPYKPHKDFAGAFSNDSFRVEKKPDDLFTEGKDFDKSQKLRVSYDEFILNLDHEFGLLLEKIENAGILDDTWVVFTADHGEIFERGITGHTTPTLYQPLVHIPLIIFEPGRRVREDIYAPTSAIDVMPTLLHVTGHPIPDSVEGTILPPYNSASKMGTGPYTVQARYNEVTLPITEASIMHVIDNYKLIYYIGYDKLGGEGEKYMLFDIKTDPEELNDLSQSKRETALEILNIVKTRLKESNDTYQ